GAFGHHHDAEVAPARVTAAQALGDLLDVKGALGNQDDVGAAGDPAVHRDPAGVAAHDLHHDDPVVSLGGGVHTVNGFGGNTDGGVEAEAEVGAAEIVVNGLGNADYLDSALVQAHGDRLRVVAADGDEGVNLVAAQVLHAALQAAFALGRVGARGAQDGAAARQDAGHRLQVERHGLVFHHPAPAFHEADELVAVVEDAFANDGSYDGVQPGAVAAAGENSDLHNCVLKRHGRRRPVYILVGWRQAVGARAVVVLRCRRKKRLNHYKEFFCVHKLRGISSQFSVPGSQLTGLAAGLSVRARSPFLHELKLRIRGLSRIGNWRLELRTGN